MDELYSMLGDLMRQASEGDPNAKTALSFVALMGNAASLQEKVMDLSNSRSLMVSTMKTMASLDKQIQQKEIECELWEERTDEEAMDIRKERQQYNEMEDNLKHMTARVNAMEDALLPSLNQFFERCEAFFNTVISGSEEN